ncbi:MAG: PucR family transcriptional regulator [Clostridiales bacterium]|nr:PucR family transcriptional regulator [Clostridiales bacterium]
MAMTCRELLKLASLKNARLAAGSDGLDKNIRWIYVAEGIEDPRQISNWLYGGELVFITGFGIKNNTALLVEFVESINTKKVSGLVINIGPYIPSIPSEIIALADRLALPVFELPWESKLIDITHEVCLSIIQKEQEEKSVSNLIETILFSDIPLDDNIIGRASFYGYDLKGPCRVMIMNFNNIASYLRKKNIFEDKKILDMKASMKKSIQEVVFKFNKKTLLMLRSDSLILLMNVQSTSSSDINGMADAVRELIAKKYPGLTFILGIGNTYQELSYMKKSFSEAEYSLKVAKLGTPGNSVYFYTDLGIYSLLYSIKDQQVLNNFMVETLGPLIEHDKVSSNQLIQTLEAFLRESGNITITSEKLFIHKNTLKYRIQKIEEITGFSLKDMQDCFKLQLALMIAGIIKNTPE